MNVVSVSTTEEDDHALVWAFDTPITTAIDAGGLHDANAGSVTGFGGAGANALRVSYENATAAGDAWDVDVENVILFFEDGKTLNASSGVVS